jgi:formylglycine-generating enzyme required for sulfatase activity
MALEHRIMHLETLAYMWHNFDHQAKIRPASEPLEHSAGAPPRNDWCDIPAGVAVLGKKRDESFGWDNEYDEHEVFVPSFRVQRFKVTNGEYLEFVREGAPLPHFWMEQNGRLYLRGMFEQIPLPLDWPVYVSQQEALAYATWLGKSLPDEAQFHRAAYGSPKNESRLYPWGNALPSANLGNFDLRRWDPEPVHFASAGASAFGARQLAGNGWEWTSTPFAPFAGFKPAPSYPGYSANFFDGQHFVMKGGSPRTGARLLRKSFRNWFRRDYPYAYGAFRCVEN